MLTLAVLSLLASDSAELNPFACNRPTLSCETVEPPLVNRLAAPIGGSWWVAPDGFPCGDRVRSLDRVGQPPIAFEIVTTNIGSLVIDVPDLTNVGDEWEAVITDDGCAGERSIVLTVLPPIDPPDPVTIGTVTCVPQGEACGGACVEDSGCGFGNGIEGHVPSICDVTYVGGPAVLSATDETQFSPSQVLVERVADEAVARLTINACVGGPTQLIITAFDPDTLEEIASQSVEVPAQPVVGFEDLPTCTEYCSGCHCAAASTTTMWPTLLGLSAFVAILGLRRRFGAT